MVFLDSLHTRYLRTGRLTTSCANRASNYFDLKKPGDA